MTKFSFTNYKPPTRSKYPVTERAKQFFIGLTEGLIPFAQIAEYALLNVHGLSEKQRINYAKRFLHSDIEIDRINKLILRESNPIILLILAKAYKNGFMDKVYTFNNEPIRSSNLYSNDTVSETFNRYISIRTLECVNIIRHIRSLSLKENESKDLIDIFENILDVAKNPTVQYLLIDKSYNFFKGLFTTAEPLVQVALGGLKIFPCLPEQIRKKYANKVVSSRYSDTIYDALETETNQQLQIQFFDAYHKRAELTISTINRPDEKKEYLYHLENQITHYCKSSNHSTQINSKLELIFLWIEKLKSEIGVTNSEKWENEIKEHQLKLLFWVYTSIKNLVEKLRSIIKGNTTPKS